MKVGELLDRLELMANDRRTMDIVFVDRNSDGHEIVGLEAGDNNELWITGGDLV